MTPWISVFIFISSTFLDMHAERGLLVKRVFPFLLDDAAVKREIYAGSEEDDEKQRSFRDYIKASVSGDSIFSYTARLDRSLYTPKLRAKSHPGTVVKMSDTGTCDKSAFVSASDDIVASVNRFDDKMKIFRAASGKLSKISEIKPELRNREVSIACVCGALRDSNDFLVLYASCSTGSTRVIRVFSDVSGETTVFHSDRQFSTMEAFGAHAGMVLLHGTDRHGAVISV